MECMRLDVTDDVQLSIHHFVPALISTHTDLPTPGLVGNERGSYSHSQHPLAPLELLEQTPGEMRCPQVLVGGIQILR